MKLKAGDVIAGADTKNVIGPSHMIRKDGRTLCGRDPAKINDVDLEDPPVTCGGCIRSIKLTIENHLQACTWTIPYVEGLIL